MSWTQNPKNSEIPCPRNRPCSENSDPGKHLYTVQRPHNFRHRPLNSSQSQGILGKTEAFQRPHALQLTYPKSSEIWKSDFRSPQNSQTSQPRIKTQQLLRELPNRDKDGQTVQRPHIPNMMVGHTKTTSAETQALNQLSNLALNRFLFRHVTNWTDFPPNSSEPSTLRHVCKQLKGLMF